MRLLWQGTKIDESGVRMSADLAVLFAVAAGLAVGNLYWAQPLLAVISQDLGIPASQSAFLVTATQMGYALGILLIVPLGDVLERRKLLVAAMLATVLALALCAAASSFLALSIALGALGFCTVSGQIVLPLAGDLADDASRGRVVGIVSSGITAGILFSRLLSGLTAELWDWRGIFILAAALNLVMAAIVYLSVPQLSARAKVSYRALLSDVFTSVRRYSAIRAILLKQGMIFGVAFNLFWTASTFLLSKEPFAYGSFQIGLVSLAGLTGALAGAKVGALRDKGLGVLGETCFIGCSALSMFLAVFSSHSIFAVIAIAALFSLAVQGEGILSQARLFALSSVERSRLNTIFVASNFLFCAVGSGLASFLWDLGGWEAAAWGGTAASIIAGIVHIYECGKGALRTDGDGVF